MIGRVLRVAAAVFASVAVVSDGAQDGPVAQDDQAAASVAVTPNLKGSNRSRIGEGRAIEIVLDRGPARNRWGVAIHLREFPSAQ